MNAIARYLLVFLLGWSGAVWSYSDLIYKTNETSEKIETPQITLGLVRKIFDFVDVISFFVNRFE